MEKTTLEHGLEESLARYGKRLRPRIYWNHASNAPDRDPANPVMQLPDFLFRRFASIGPFMLRYELRTGAPPEPGLADEVICAMGYSSQAIMLFHNTQQATPEAFERNSVPLTLLASPALGRFGHVDFDIHFTRETLKFYDELLHAKYKIGKISDSSGFLDPIREFLDGYG